MKLKEIKPSKEKSIPKFKNFQEELSFIKKEKKDNKEKLTQQDVHEISRNIIKDKIIVKKFVEALLRFYEPYYKPNAHLFDWEKLTKIAKTYKQKTTYSDTEGYLKIIEDNIYNNNRILQRIQIAKENYHGDKRNILKYIIGYGGGPFHKEVKVEINPLSLELTFKSSEDLMTFYHNCRGTGPIYEGFITDISTKHGYLKTLIVYNEEYIDDLANINKDNFPNIKNFKKYLQKTSRLHEQQHALWRYLWKKSFISTSNENKTELIETIEFDKFIQGTSDEILAHYLGDHFATKEILTVLAENYHQLYKTLARIYYKEQIQSNNKKNSDDSEDIQQKIKVKSQQEIKKYADIATHAIMSLEQAGYNKKEIAYYLSDEPLTKWNLLAKRLIDNKDISKTK